MSARKTKLYVFFEILAKLIVPFKYISLLVSVRKIYLYRCDVS
jgi:hypothetical protein